MSFRVPFVSWPLAGLAVFLTVHCAGTWQCRSCGFFDDVSYRLGFYDSAREQLVADGGLVYDGPLVNAVATGYGTLRAQSGYALSGTWAGGFLQPGAGSYGFPDGNVYDGRWERRSGGVERHKRDFALVMCLQDDCSAGRGLLVDQFLEMVYVGEFRDGDFHGRGALFWQYRLIEVDGRMVEIKEQDYFIYAGNFEAGELKGGTLYCLRALQFCGYLYSVLRSTPGAPRVERVDSFGFFQDRLRPRLAEFIAGARYLIPLSVQ